MSAEKVLARCPACSKRYRIPRERSDVRCPQCRGALELVADPPRSESVAALAPPPEPKPPLDETAPSSPLGAATETDREERLRIAAELRNAQRWITPARVLFVARALLAGTLVALTLALVRNESVALDDVWIAIAGGALVAAVSLAGAITLPHFPLASTLALLGVQTVFSGLHVVVDGRVPKLELLCTAFVACLLPPMLRLRGLVRRHPDQYWAHVVAGTSNRRLEVARGSRAALGTQTALIDAARRRALALACGAAAFVLALAGAATWQQHGHVTPQAFDDVSREFEIAWNGSDVGALAAFAGDEIAPRGRVVETLANRGWEERRPRSGASRVEGSGAHRALTLVVEGDDEVEARWGWSDGAWRLTQLTLPDPELEPAAARFCDTWNHSGIDAVAALFPADRAARVKRSLEAVAKRNRWEGGWTKITETREEVLNGGRALLRCTTSEGARFEAEFRLERGEWRIAAISF